MIWLDEELKNPLSGKTLKRDSPHSFSDGKQRFPVVEEIPFLRVKRDELRHATLAMLDAGDERGATTLLLRDRDDWASGVPPTEEDLQPLFENEKLTLRGAMHNLKYGAVADYFAYRWSDPTFLSGLCLLENHLSPTVKKVFELCCGIGHYLREFALRNIDSTGADVVFSKLWLARKFVAPKAKLVCLDANFDLPFASESFDAAFCHDAFYFLPEKSHVASELKRTTKKAILIGHAHNSEAENYSSGAAISISEYSAMFESPVLYDDAELTEAFIENRTPNRQIIEELKKSEAVAIITNKQNAAGTFGFSLPPLGRSLRVNPLLDAGNFELLKAPNYPSERYEKEYAPLSKYLVLNNEDISFSIQEMMFYGHWGRNERWIDLVRRRIFLDLPEDW
jgi:SAM-dependent methyltransferase